MVPISTYANKIFEDVVSISDTKARDKDIVTPLLTGFIPEQVNDILTLCFAYLFGALAPDHLRSVRVLRTPKKAWLAWKTDDGIEIHNMNNSTILEVLKTLYPTILECCVSRVIHNPGYDGSKKTVAKMILGEFSKKFQYNEYGNSRNMSIFDIIKQKRATDTVANLAQEFLPYIPRVKICRSILQ